MGSDKGGVSGVAHSDDGDVERVGVGVGRAVENVANAYVNLTRGENRLCAGG